jgi:hypothetical protein
MADGCRLSPCASSAMSGCRGMVCALPQQLKTLEDENARLKKLLAEAMLDNAILEDVASKKW